MFINDYDKMAKIKFRLWNNRKEYMVIFFITILTMLICTKSSPLYPLNLWVDSNAYFTAGKSMFQGNVLYKDIFDHKGPILHFLHGLAWLISNDSFIGVWFIEIIACFCFLLLSYRTIELFIGEKGLILIPLLSVIIYSSYAMYQGDSVEELCLPLIMYALYIIIKSIKENKEIPRFYLFLLGITSGFVLWMKYTLLGFYIGWAIIPIIYSIKQKNWKYIGNIVFFIGLGVIFVTSIVLAYFCCNNALDSLWEVYFYKNMFTYGEQEITLFSSIIPFFSKIILSMLENPFLWCSIILGIVFLLVKKEYCVFKQVTFMLTVGLISIK